MIQIDFEKFNKVGLKQILKKFEKEGLTVADVEGNNKAKRESGFQVKSATIIFESGQKLLVKAKAGGSIFQVKLNNKVLPIKHVDDLDKAILEIINYVQMNEKNYKKQQEKRLARQKVNVPKIRPVSTSIAEQITQYQATIDEAAAADDSLGSQIAEIETANVEKQTTVESLTQELNDLILNGNALQAEYDQLKEAA